MKPKTIVFIHGMYMTPLCWEHWLARFEGQGYRCLAPAWPLHDRPVAALREAHPDQELGRLTLRAIVDELAQTIAALPEKPVIIGHSMGGLVTQLLRQRGLAAAAVAIDSAAPAGVFTASWPFIKSNWPHINPFAQQFHPIEMTFERFQYTYVNDLPADEQQAAFERYVVPESRRVPAESLTGIAKIDYQQPGPPLLFIAGSNDHLIPAALNKANYAKYAAAGAPVELKEFPGRTHFIVGQTGWEEVADFARDWLRRV